MSTKTKTAAAAGEPFDAEAATTEYRNRYRGALSSVVSVLGAKQAEASQALRAQRGGVTRAVRALTTPTR